MKSILVSILSEFVNSIMVVLYNKMFTAFHKLFLPIKNNLLGFEDDKHINKQNKNIKKLTPKEEAHTNNEIGRAHV